MWNRSCAVCNRPFWEATVNSHDYLKVRDVTYKYEDIMLYELRQTCSL